MSTVVSIVEAANGGAAQSYFMEAVEWVRWWHADPAHQKFLKHERALKFFKDLPRLTENWVQRIKYVRREALVGLEKAVTMVGRGSVTYEAAVARIAAQEAFVSHAARMAALNATATAAEGTLVAGVGTTIAAVVVPVVAMVAVQVALGAGYYQARELARKEGYNMGFAKGFITGLLKWELQFTIERFWDNAVGKNNMDEAIPQIRANSHNQGLINGRVAGLAIKDVDKKNYLLGLRKLTTTSTAGWTPKSENWMDRAQARQVQISYVIDLAGAALKHHVLEVE